MQPNIRRIYFIQPRLGAMLQTTQQADTKAVQIAPAILASCVGSCEVKIPDTGRIIVITVSVPAYDQLSERRYEGSLFLHFINIKAGLRLGARAGAKHFESAVSAIHHDDGESRECCALAGRFR